MSDIQNQRLYRNLSINFNRRKIAHTNAKLKFLIRLNRFFFIIYKNNIYYAIYWRFIGVSSCSIQFRHNVENVNHHSVNFDQSIKPATISMILLKKIIIKKNREFPENFIISVIYRSAPPEKSN